MEDYLQYTYTQKDIENYISSQSQEKIHLEFKIGDALKLDDKTRNEIVKDVSAFANSDGGIIIYGIEEKKFKAANLQFVNGHEIKKEWLEQVLNSRIQRKIDGLRIDTIRYDNKIEQTIYVVKIPRSLNVPHMTSEKKFYKRYNFESVAMEEYEIRNLYNRQEKTILEITEPKIKGSPQMLNGGKIVDFMTTIEFNILNKGKSIEKLYKLEIHIPRLAVIHSSKWGTPNYFKFLVRHEDTYSIFSLPNTSPLFQNEFATVGIFELVINSHNFDDVKNNSINMKLFHTNGTEGKSFNLLDYLEYKSKRLTFDDFTK